VSICVAPNVRRKGVGHALLSFFEAECVRREIKSATLVVHEPNLAARSLYEKHGWVPYVGNSVQLRYIQNFG
jgi:ribosomal protein S18 acetylase RimI-like enzyme